jgi:putative membrane protein
MTTRSRTLSTEDHDRVSAAIHDAERRTSGEIVCVLARESTDSTALPLLLAALAAMIVPWPLLFYTALPVNLILLTQLLTFFILALVLCMPRVRIALVPRAARRAMAHRMALEQFMIRGIGRKADRTGVLIFVSLAERYARIVADRAIADRVPQSEWQHAVDALISHPSRGDIPGGFVAAIERCGTVLEANFPRQEGDRRELPDRIYVI